MDSVSDSFIQVPLNSEAHHLALQFSALHVSPQKGKRVYLNTLAVYAVHTYLNWFGIPSDLTQSNCWNSDHQVVSESADLVIPNVGKVECCSVLPGDTAIVIPPDAMAERLGYVAVQFEDVLDAVHLLGFLLASADLTEQLLIQSLYPLEDLVDHIAPQHFNTEMIEKVNTSKS